MNFSKDLIVVHFQEGFFDNSNQTMKSIAKKRIGSLVDQALKTSDIHISFWEDRTISDPSSVVPIPSNNEKVDRQNAPAGVVHNYQLKGPEVILTGGWFGACINNAINSVIFSYFENTALADTGSLDIRLPLDAVYKFSDLLSGNLTG